MYQTMFEIYKVYKSQNYIKYPNLARRELICQQGECVFSKVKTVSGE